MSGNYLLQAKGATKKAAKALKNYEKKRAAVQKKFAAFGVSTIEEYIAELQARLAAME